MVGYGGGSLTVGQVVKRGDEIDSENFLPEIRKFRRVAVARNAQQHQQRPSHSCAPKQHFIHFDIFF